ncbi:hypothetical protein E2C01_024526 [Portunus trituberculatus]|uniref:Uncharacterized protein n=1 Tax=Portunus trituberculatus TaxID=210409 RepID=A0A5B7EAT7_PORTR|nr:hypothetical protein [Portunus trituberculatus]
MVGLVSTGPSQQCNTEPRTVGGREVDTTEHTTATFMATFLEKCHIEAQYHICIYYGNFTIHYNTISKHQPFLNMSPPVTVHTLVKVQDIKKIEDENEKATEVNMLTNQLQDHKNNKRLHHHFHTPLVDNNPCRCLSLGEGT